LRVSNLSLRFSNIVGYYTTEPDGLFIFRRSQTLSPRNTAHIPVNASPNSV